MSVFRQQLSAAQPVDSQSPDPSARRWLFVPYDQLSDGIGPLSREAPETLGIVLIETRHKPARRPYHQQKLALLLTNMRHFALEQARRGVAVRYLHSDRPYAELLREQAAELGPLACMDPAERELRAELQPLFDQGLLERLPHEGWLSTPGDFAKAGKGPFRMDAFYRHLRRATGILMQDGKPVGGRFSFDGDNRKPWKGEPPAPMPPSFPMDPVKEEVLALVSEHFAHHPGRLDPTQIPGTLAQARSLWAWAQRACMTHFGPYEDAMSTRSRGLFHTRISPLLNLHRLLPAQVLADALELDIPLNSKEGFVRQLLGWREFVRHIHRVTDGMRRFQGQELRDPLSRSAPLPPGYWEGAPTGLECLDREVAAVWETGWTHHIPRLMVLSNIATLLDIDPWALSDWFWVGFIDAFDWVVEPNVVGMGTFGVGELMTTKPYVSGANYIHKMGDACAQCAFHPKKSCPLTPMYWAFLQRHREVFAGNHRMNIVMSSLGRRGPDKQAEDRRVFEVVQRALQAGERLTPQTLEQSGQGSLF